MADAFKGKKVFISGGAGVIGSELVSLLHARGARIFVGDLKPRPRKWPADIRYRQGDLNLITKRELDDFAPEFFFHLAASFERSEESYDFWDEQWRNNPNLSHYLASILKDSTTLKHVVFASSYLIYDKNLYTSINVPSAAHRLAENARISPRNLTGVAKLAHEVELAFIRRFRKELHVVSARIYRSYGKESRDVVSRWVRSLLVGEKVEVYHQENIFDYVYAGDVAEGLMRLAEVPWSGSVNLATGCARRVSDVLAALRDHFPTFSVRHYSSSEPYEASEADTTLLEEVVGWHPPTTLEKGVARIVAFEKARMKHGSRTMPSAGNVLITSVARKVPLVKAVRRAINAVGSGELLFGGDVDPVSLGRYFVDKFWRMPETCDENAKEILSFCKKNNIDRIIPTRDGELPFWAKHAAVFRREGVIVMVSSHQAIATTLDKLAFYRWGAARRFAVIKTSEKIGDIRAARYVVKERFGAGSRSVGLDLTKAQAVEHAKRLERPIFQPFVRGTEYSVDVYVDKKGKSKGAVVRRRVAVVNGESQITTVVAHEKIARVCAGMAEALRLREHAVFQVLLGADDSLAIVECNARFGGASGAAIAAGLDSFYWFLLEARGVDISEYPFLPYHGLLTMVRYKEDMLLT